MRGILRIYLVVSVFWSAALGGLVLPWTAMAGPLGHDAARFASGSGDILFLTIGTALPLLTDGDQGEDHALRTLDALMISILLSEGLKALIPEERPDGSDDRSFPSGHATAAFAVATAESVWHPKQAPFWYLGALIIADSRLELNKHRAVDVLAGAALGYFTAQLELSQPHGILLSPFIDSNGGCVGVQMTAVF